MSPVVKEMVYGRKDLLKSQAQIYKYSIQMPYLLFTANHIM